MNVTAKVEGWCTVTWEIAICTCWPVVTQNPTPLGATSALVKAQA